MRGFNHQLVVTTTLDEATGNEVPLFAFPVQICKATADREVRFDSAGPEGEKVERVYRSTLTGEIVEPQKGVRSGESFAAIDPEAIKAIDAALKTDQIRVAEPVKLSDVPFDRITGRYFLQVPAKGGQPTAYAGLYKSLLAEGRGLRVTFVSRSRQKVGVIYASAEDECLMLSTVEFAENLRAPDEQVKAGAQAEVADEMVKKIGAVLDGLDSDGGFDVPVDEGLLKRKELVEQALAGEAIEVPETAGAAPAADDLSAALEASLAAV